MSTSDPDSDGSSDAEGVGRRRKKGAGGSGRETEEEMRKRILEQLEEERAGLEREVQELKDKEEEERTTGKL